MKTHPLWLPVCLGRTLAPLLLTTTGAMAQDVSVTTSARTPIVATFSDGVQTTQASLPIGPLPSLGVVQAPSTGAASARVNWSRSFGNDEIDYQLVANCLTGPQGSASCGPFEVLVELTAVSARAVAIEVSRADAMTAGQAWPQLDIDVDNDGFVDYVDVASGAPFVLSPFQLGAAPRVLRVVMGASAIAPGQAAVGLFLRIRPDNGVLAVHEAYACPAGATMAEPRAAFVDQGVNLDFTPGLLVLGFTSAPTVWTPYTVPPFAATCLLLPSVDFVLWAPTGSQHLPLPAAVRPLDLHVQAVIPGPNGFSASDAYVIHAL